MPREIENYKIYKLLNIFWYDLTKEIIVFNVVNDYTISMIKEWIKSNLNQYHSTYPPIAIAKWVVSLSFNPYTMKSRKSKDAIEIGICNIWNELKHTYLIINLKKIF